MKITWLEVALIKKERHRQKLFPPLFFVSYRVINLWPVNTTFISKHSGALKKNNFWVFELLWILNITLNFSRTYQRPAKNKRAELVLSKFVLRFTLFMIGSVKSLQKWWRTMFRLEMRKKIEKKAGIMYINFHLMIF